MRSAWIALAVALGVALGVAPGCSSEPDEGVAIPSFAARLPGSTAVVVFDARGELPQIVREALREVTGESTGWGREPGLAYLALDEPAGWTDLAQSRSFRAALRDLGPDPATVAYVDLQQVVDVALARHVEALPGATRVLDVLELASFRYAVAELVEREDGGRSVRGAVSTSGGKAGLAGVLAGAPGTPGLLGEAPADAVLSVEAEIDFGVVQRMFAQLTADGATLPNLAASAMAGVLQGVVKSAIEHCTGRMSLQVTPSGALLALAIRDPEGLRDLLDRYLREGSGDTWHLPGGRLVQVDGDRILFGPTGVEHPRPGGAPLDASLRVRWRVQDGRTLRLDVQAPDQGWTFEGSL